MTVIFLSAACGRSAADTAYAYQFKKGSIPRLNYPKGFQTEPPELIISNGKARKRLSLPLGTEIWKERTKAGSLIVRYMDKRFAAYASFAYSLINLDTLEVSAVVTDVVHELDAGNDDYLVGVQRVAQDVDFLDARDDTDYNNACQILFVIKFDYQHHTFQRLNIASGSHFPDDNPVYSEEESERIEKQFHVDAGVLNYAKGGVARQFALSDFDRKANLRAIREIAADRAD